ncbi:phosphoribosyltransferase family protein [Thermofilum pendens]|uniref:Phosphoribosyltransferase n=1 Tax=Thermofilum pendens (strain DSM 2475 / Hrk 5) TaxID=368408 RepID=A1RZ71_THEPD|nr:phosphoribosyltransferase family protein [Thermofilum pendens]ABL78501.1 phosphoribosyltransferase [Thermofilum pendens Hrk 5]
MPISRSEAEVPRILASRVLRSLKSYVPLQEVYRALREEKVEVSPSELSRYAAGHSLPPSLKAVHILVALKRRGLLREILSKKISMDENGVVNVAQLAYDVEVLSAAVASAYPTFFRGVDVVLTAAVNGIPLASFAAWALDARLAVARRERESPSMKYLTAYLFQRDPPSVVPLYVPSSLLERGARVLIVDDLLRTGRTLKALLSLIDEADAEPVGVLALVSLSEAWKSVLTRDIQTMVILELASQGSTQP